MFFPEEGSLEDRGNIFHGQLYPGRIPSISSQLCVQEQILWSLFRPLKSWYKLKSCGNKCRRNEKLLNIRKFRNRTVWRYNQAPIKIFIITWNYLLGNLVSIRRTVLLAEFLTIFALKIIFNRRNRHGTSELKKESKMNLRSHFAHWNLHKSQQITYQNAVNLFNSLNLAVHLLFWACSVELVQFFSTCCFQDRSRFCKFTSKPTEKNIKMPHRNLDKITQVFHH